MVARNKVQGSNFEAILRGRAGAGGFKALRNELAFRYAPGGRIVPMRADLDFRILSPSGKVAFCDTKVVATPYFLPSRMDRHQVARAMVYNAYRVPAGFVVLFTQSELVSFFTGQQIGRAHAKVRFTPAMGTPLGRLASFSLADVFAQLDAVAIP